MPSSTNRTMGAREWATLVLLALIWGGSFIFIKIIVAELGPLTLVLGRVSLGALTLLLVVRLSGSHMPRDPKIWTSFLFMGLINNLLPFSLVSWGQTQISASLASILNAATPVWAVILAHFLTTDEKLTPNRLGGVILGLVGVAIMIGWDALSGLGLNTLAQLAIVGAGVCYSLAGIYGKRFKDIPPLVTAAGQLTGTAVLALPVTLLVEKPWLVPLPELKTWAALLALGFISTALAYILYFRLLASAGATNLMLVTLLVPVSAILLGTLVLGEVLLARQIVGMGLIALSLAFIDGRVLRLMMRPKNEDGGRKKLTGGQGDLETREMGCAHDRRPGDGHRSESKGLRSIDPPDKSGG